VLLEKKDEFAGCSKRTYEPLSSDPWLVANKAARLERLKKLGGLNQ